MFVRPPSNRLPVALQSSRMSQSTVVGGKQAASPKVLERNVWRPFFFFVISNYQTNAGLLRKLKLKSVRERGNSCTKDD